MKGRLRPMLGFKTFYNARRVIIGIELAQKIHKRQFAIPIPWQSNPAVICVTSWQHRPHRRGALLILSLRQSYLHQNRCTHAGLARQLAVGPPAFTASAHSASLSV